MPAIDQLGEKLFNDAITRAVQDVFKTMFNLSAVLAAPPKIPEAVPAGPRPAPLIDGQLVVGTVGFIGEISGLIYLYLDASFANRLSSHLLGLSLEELAESGDECVNDAVGEITNMTVGAFKNQLCDQGLPCKLTIPSILRGSNFSIEPITSATRRIYRFRVGDQVLVADLLMQQGE